MIRKSFVYLLANINIRGSFPGFSRKVVIFLCYSLLLSPLHAWAENCATIDYNIATIAAGTYHTVGLKEDGTVVAVGYAWGGQLNVGDWTGIKAVSAYGPTVGLKEDGTVVAAGVYRDDPSKYLGWDGWTGFNVGDWTDIKAVSAGGGHIVGLKEDGTVVAVGTYSDGQLNVSSWSGIKAIAAGSTYTVGVKEDGTVVAVGGNYYDRLNVGGWTNIKAVSASGMHTVGLKEDGTVVAVGNNRNGQLNVSGWTGIKAVSAGGVHTVGLKEDGTVVAVGAVGRNRGQLNVSGWTNIKAIAAGDSHTVGLKEDGTVVAVGANWYGQLNVGTWTGIRQPACLDSLQPPSSLTASDTPCDNGGSINLTWTLSPDDGSKVTGYRVYRSTTSGGQYDLIGSVNTGVNNYTDAAASTGVTYYYVVRATDGTNESASSNEASIASTRNLPLPPSSVTATDTPYDLGGSITLAWTKSLDDGAGLNNVSIYNIYRYSSTNGNRVLLTSAPAGTTSYVDNTTVDADTYYYSISALDWHCNIESAASDVIYGQSINNMTALPDFIGGLPGIAPQLVNSLTSKVDNAITALDRGNETAAINMLEALLHEIEAQSGNKIDMGAADILRTYIGNLISYIQRN